MDKSELRELVMKRNSACSHSWMVVGYKKTERSESATVLSCQHCLQLINFQDLAEVSCEKRKTDYSE